MAAPGRTLGRLARAFPLWRSYIGEELFDLVGIGRIHPQRALEEFTRLLLHKTFQAGRVTLAASAVQETVRLGRPMGIGRMHPYLHLAGLLAPYLFL